MYGPKLEICRPFHCLVALMTFFQVLVATVVRLQIVAMRKKRSPFCTTEMQELKTVIKKHQSILRFVYAASNGTVFRS